MSAELIQKKSSGNGRNPPLTPRRYSNINVENPSVERIRVEDESDIEKLYQIGEVLGKGSFGIVREVTHRTTKEKFAMKVVNKDKPGSISIQLLEREVAVLKRVHHPNIILLEAVYETAKKVYMIMELCRGGELSDELKKCSHFSEQATKTIMRKIVEAVVYLHDNDVVHRDLKLENVLLTSDSPEPEFDLRVTDFGLACMKDLDMTGRCDLMDSKCGTPFYMAPEVLSTKHEYTKMCDVWSLGVIMYALVSGRYPFHSNKVAKLEELITAGELTFVEEEWTKVTTAAKDLVRNMLRVDTTSRYTARRILDDPWFTGEHSKRTMNALDLMRDMDSETHKTRTSIIISSSTTENVLTVPPANDVSSSPSRTTPDPPPPSSSLGKVTIASSHSSQSSSSQTSNRRLPNTGRKLPAPSGKAVKHRTQSSSALFNSGGNPKNLSGHTSTSALPSPSHKQSNSSSNSGLGGTSGATRSRNFSVGSKSQVMSNSQPAVSPTRRPNSGSLPVHKETKDRKLTSPNAKGRT